jgi:formylglycine-generating enzyme required for sulfatase activity
VAKPDHAILNFILALALIAASAGIGIYRTQRGAQVFSEPLFEPVAPTEVITASQLSDDVTPVRATASSNLHEVLPESEIAFQPAVLSESVARALAAKRALSTDQIRQLRALFGPAAQGLPAGTPAARAQVLKALNDATKARVPDTLLPDAPSLLAALKGVEDGNARRVRARLNEAVTREGKLARAETLLQKLPLTRERLALAAGNFQAVLKVDASNARALRGLDFLEQQSVASSALLRVNYAFPDAFALLTLAEKQVQGGSSIRAERAAMFVAQANAEASLLQEFSAALRGKNIAQADTVITKLNRFLPEERITSMRAQISNAELYGGFERGQSFSDSMIVTSADATKRDSSASGPLMRVLPIGSFVMGSAQNESGRAANEGPQRELKVSKGLALGSSEITVAQFAAFVAATGYQSDAEQQGDSIIYEETTGRMTRAKGVDWRADYVGKIAADNAPVLHVSFQDANAYARWLSSVTGQRYRLPSEAEFEYALRAGSKSAYWWGAKSPEEIVENLTGSNDRSDSGRSWSSGFAGYGDAFWGPAPVQHFMPNPFGLFDISGNVAEWTADCWHESYARAPSDMGEWVNPGCAQRVVRGASWGSAPEESRSAARAAFNSTHRSAKIGFRVLREL